MPPHAQQFAGNPTETKGQAAFDISQAQLPGPDLLPDGGTAALPHILMRYYTTPSVKEARDSVTWIAVLHLPALLHGAGLGGAGQVRGL
jgi:cation/acetate symporter